MNSWRGMACWASHQRKATWPPRFRSWPHALDGLRAGDYQYSMFLAKGSLFLGRMTHLSDGESFVLEANSGAG